MDIRNFALSYYKNASEGIHVQRISESEAASKPHTHAYFQIYYVSKGSVVHYVGSVSSKLTKADMFIVPPGTTHYIQAAPDSLFYTFSFAPDIFGETCDNNRLATNFLRYLENAIGEEIHPKIAVPLEEVLHIESVMEQMVRVFSEKSLGYAELLRAYGIVLLTLFARVYYEAMPNEFALDAGNSRQAVLFGIAYIDANFAEQITLADIAKRCAMSKSSFCALFSDVTGMTFLQYLNTCRVNHAIRLIRKGYKITSIYCFCGYKDFSTFYRNFKKITGLSPEQFRKTDTMEK